VIAGCLIRGMLCGINLRSARSVNPGAASGRLWRSHGSGKGGERSVPCGWVRGAEKGLQKRISEVNPGERSLVLGPGEVPVRKA